MRRLISGSCLLLTFISTCLLLSSSSYIPRSFSCFSRVRWFFGSLIDRQIDRQTIKQPLFVESASFSARLNSLLSIFFNGSSFFSSVIRSRSSRNVSAVAKQQAVYWCHPSYIYPMVSFIFSRLFQIMLIVFWTSTRFRQTFHLYLKALAVLVCKETPLALGDLGHCSHKSDSLGGFPPQWVYLQLLTDTRQREPPDGIEELARTNREEYDLG